MPHNDASTPAEACSNPGDLNAPPDKGNRGNTNSTIGSPAEEIGQKPASAHPHEPDSDPAPDTTKAESDRANATQCSLQKKAAFEHAKQFDANGRQIFPVSALPDILRRYVTQISEVECLPVEIIAPATLAAVSVSMGAGIKINTREGMSTRGNLYIMGILSSGTGKGTVCDEVFAPIFEAEKVVIQDWKDNTLPGIRAAERMVKDNIRRIMKEATKDPEDQRDAFNEIAAFEKHLDVIARLKIEPRLGCEDVTREKLSDLLSGQPGEALASISSEARGILDVLTRLKGEDLYTKAWSGESYRNDRRSRQSVHLKSPCLSAYWTIQDDAWAKLIETEVFIQSGMLPRFLFFAPDVPLEPLPSVPRRLDPDVKRNWTDLITSLLTHYRNSPGDSRTVVTDADVVAIFRDYENQLRAMRNPGGLFQDIRAFAARWTENAFRLALVLHAATHGGSAHEHPLAIETAKAALAIMDWFQAEQILLLRDRMTQADQSRANRLEQAIRRYGTRPATIPDLVNRNGFKKTEITALVERRPERFRIVEHRRAKGSLGGRPSEVVELVNKLGATPFPDIIGGFAGSAGFAGGASTKHTA